MDIVSLAVAEAGRVRRFRDGEEEESDRVERGLPEVPTLHIARTSRSGKWSVSSSGETGHPNEVRMPFVRDWLEREVLSEAAGVQDCTGTYRMQLHDSCSYLPRASEFRDTLSFGRCEGSGQSIARFPDPYQASGLMGVMDDVPWERKRPTVVFAGSTTGDVDPTRNARVRACLWARDHPDETDFRISSVVQMRPYDVCTRVPGMTDIIAPHLAPQGQFRHRFIANIVGNTACWSRVPMVMGSGSVMFHIPHDDTSWYYPAMRPGVHYVECETHEAILRCRLSCMADAEGCHRMVADAGAFSSEYLSPAAAAQYTRALLSGVRGK